MDNSPEPKETVSPFEKLLAAFARNRVDFAVVGGLAVIFNGYPRLTLDADILVSTAPDNLRQLLDCLAGWGEGWARELKPEDFVCEPGAIRVIEDFELDIFTRLSGKSLDDFRPRLRHLDAGGVPDSLSLAGGFDFSQAGFLARQGQARRASPARNHRARNENVAALDRAPQNNGSAGHCPGGFIRRFRGRRR